LEDGDFAPKKSEVLSIAFLPYSFFSMGWNSITVIFFICESVQKITSTLSKRL